jgi:alpha-galactosidase
MKIFGKEVTSGVHAISTGGAEVEYRVYTIASGVKVTGTLRGRPGCVEIARFPAPSEYLVHNWQSWGPVEWLRHGSRVEGTAYALERGNLPLFSPLPDLFPRRTISDYVLCGGEFLAGFLAARIAHPFFVVEGDEIVACLEYFGTSFEQPVALEPFLFLRGSSADALLRTYGALVAEETPPRRPAANPVGWCSWYHYFDRVTWEDIVKNLQAARGTTPYRVFQIDDGYQADVGDWLLPREGWPPLPEMARAIHDHGFLPGIWSSPFMVAETSGLYREHPEWIVRRGGELIPAFTGWEKNTYPLDTTHPGAQEWLRRTFQSLREAGFRYFKIDFLYAAAMPGERFRPVTPVSAYRQGLRIIREAVGNDFVLGCGAPLLPAVGYVDGMRVGEDTAPFWDRNLSAYHGPNAYHALRTPLRRQFMHRNFWLNDPDCLILRNREVKLAANEREAYALVAGALDAMLMQSDDLTLVDEAGKGMLREAIRLRGGSATVENPGRGDLFIVTTREGPAGTRALAVNLADEPATVGGVTVPARSAIPLSA